MHIERSIIQSKIWTSTLQIWMSIPVTLISSYIFVDIMMLYVINLDIVSLFADSSFTFLTVWNDVLCRFE